MESFIHPTLGTLENILSIQPIDCDEYFLFKNGKKFYMGYLKNGDESLPSNITILTRIKNHKFMSPIVKFQKLINEIIKHKIIFSEPKIY